MAEHQTTTTTVRTPSDTPQPQHTSDSQSIKRNEGSDQLQEEGGTFTLLLFAAASTYTGNDSLTWSAPMTLQQVFDILEERYAGIKRKVLRTSAVTVNLEYVEFEVDEEGNVVSVEGIESGEGGGEGDGDGGGMVIKKGDEVGIIPPVSSG